MVALISSGLCSNLGTTMFWSLKTEANTANWGTWWTSWFLTLLVKNVHSTRCRQIVETQSVRELTSKEHEILSEDQKHSSAVAKVHYQKQRSREVAVRSQECLQKLQGTKASEVDKEVNTGLSDATSSSAELTDSTESKSVPPKGDAPPTNRLRIQRTASVVRLKEVIVGCWNLRRMKTSFQRKGFISTDSDNGLLFWEIPTTNFRKDEWRILWRKGQNWSSWLKTSRSMDETICGEPAAPPFRPPRPRPNKKKRKTKESNAKWMCVKFCFNSFDCDSSSRLCFVFFSLVGLLALRTTSLPLRAVHAQ